MHASHVQWSECNGVLAYLLEVAMFRVIGFDEFGGVFDQVYDAEWKRDAVEQWLLELGYTLGDID